MSIVMAIVAAAAFGLDRFVDEPPSTVHPVAWFGRCIEAMDRPWSRPRMVGAAIACSFPLAAAVTVGAIVTIGVLVAPGLGVGLAIIGLSVSTSHRQLVAEANRVVALSTSDLPAARAAAGGLVGRPTATLTPVELKSAAIESAAENLADGLVGPLVAFAVLAPISIAAGVAGAVWVKAVNTIDSTVGHPSTPFGTAGARLDDLVMWIPARLTAIELALIGGRPAVLSASSVDAERPRSPNSGWPMAAVAHLGDIRLEKPGEYVLNGDGQSPSATEAADAIVLVDRTAMVTWMAVIAWGLLLWGGGP